jgi:AraC family transcriptional regulator, regulatory protein of adaptative response / DNA-3-methyladenine glycosylase II
VRVPGAWDPFEAGVRALLGQQISVAAARTLLGRLIERCGTRLDPTLANAFAGNGASSASPPLTHLFPTAEQVANADLSQLGVPQSRANAVQTFARAVANGSLDLVTPRPLEEHVAALTALPGIGDWTAQYLAMRALGEPDAFPAGDLGVRQALARAAAGGGSGELPSERAVLARAEAWRPWRAYAVIALWTGHSESKTRTHSRTTKARRPTQ